MILVTGATGNVGGEVVAQLSRDALPTRALVRSQDVQLPAGVDAVVGDLDRAETVAEALRDVDGIFPLAGYAAEAELLASARQAGVRRIVLLSGGGAQATDVDNPISRYELASERTARESGLAWTILRPYAFMSNALRWAPQLREGDVVRAPFADIPVAVIDPTDIAACVVTALGSDDHAGQTYRVSGPEAILPEAQVATLATVLGRPLRFEAQTDAEARAEMAQSMPAPYVDAFFSFSRGGTLDESSPLPTVQQVTGSSPRTFVEWARAHVTEFDA